MEIAATPFQTIEIHRASIRRGICGEARGFLFLFLVAGQLRVSLFLRGKARTASKLGLMVPVPAICPRRYPCSSRARSFLTSSKPNITPLSVISLKLSWLQLPLEPFSLCSFLSRSGFPCNLSETVQSHAPRTLAPQTPLGYSPDKVVWRECNISNTKPPCWQRAKRKPLSPASAARCAPTFLVLACQIVERSIHG